MAQATDGNWYGYFADKTQATKADGPTDAYIMGFIGVAVGLIIGILIYSEVEAAIDCPDVATNPDGNEACSRAKSIAWTVISILPISMFFALFAIFGGFSRMG
jgi:ABC-type lipoprotein release transport system permease subunit